MREMRKRFEAILEPTVGSANSRFLADRLVVAAIELVGTRAKDTAPDCASSQETPSPKNEPPKAPPDRMGIDWLLAAGVPAEEVVAVVQRERKEREVAAAFEQAMGYNPLPWWTERKLSQLLRFLMDKTPEEIQRFAAWSKQNFSPLSPAKVRQYPNLAIECWPQACPPLKGQKNRGQEKSEFELALERKQNGTL